jgi:hypothetical protein
MPRCGIASALVSLLFLAIHFAQSHLFNSCYFFLIRLWQSTISNMDVDVAAVKRVQRSVRHMRHTALPALYSTTERPYSLPTLMLTTQYEPLIQLNNPNHGYRWKIRNGPHLLPGSCFSALLVYSDVLRFVLTWVILLSRLCLFSNGPPLRTDKVELALIAVADAIQCLCTNICSMFFVLSTHVWSASMPRPI